MSELSYIVVHPVRFAELLHVGREKKPLISVEQKYQKCSVSSE